MRGSILLWILGTAADVACASVHIANGTLLGVVDNDDGVEKFLGIPFAEPPVGDRRLRQAVPMGKSFGTLAQIWSQLHLRKRSRPCKRRLLDDEHLEAFERS
jgi:hypothetical protein